jgi:hypothetical protein
MEIFSMDLVSFLWILDQNFGSCLCIVGSKYLEPALIATSKHDTVADDGKWAWCSP